MLGLCWGVITTRSNLFGFEKVGTYVTNTGLMATYGGQFTLTMYLASEALCRVLACPVLVRTRHRWSAGSYCTRADTAWCYVRAALFT